ncbi:MULTISPECIES: hypothetical protein [Vibrio]|nr:hypothetical protein [Vibrio splendidus]
MYQLINPQECGMKCATPLMNQTKETAYPSVPAVYVQLQAEAQLGVRLNASCLSDILVKHYGYRYAIHGEEAVDIDEARRCVDIEPLFHDETLVRDGLSQTLRQSIPLGVLTAAPKQAEGAS